MQARKTDDALIVSLNTSRLSWYNCFLTLFDLNMDPTDPKGISTPIYDRKGNAYYPVGYAPAEFQSSSSSDLMVHSPFSLFQSKAATFFKMWHGP